MAETTTPSPPPVRPSSSPGLSVSSTSPVPRISSARKSSPADQPQPQPPRSATKKSPPKEMSGTSRPSPGETTSVVATTGITRRSNAVSPTPSSQNLTSSQPSRQSNVPVRTATSAVPPHLSVDTTQTKSRSMDSYDTVRRLFDKAYVYLNPSSLFRFVVYLYAERKLVVFFWIHFMATMVIWIHFFMRKFHQQQSTVSPTVDFYYLKLLAPPLEFATMHVILFQLALIPLTMSRFTISALSSASSGGASGGGGGSSSLGVAGPGSLINTFVPLNRMVRMHIYLGYLIITVLIVSTLFFFIFFGILCANGEEAFCQKFRSEIMITGYVIMSFFLIIGITSYLRHRIPYEYFYNIHQMVFILYALIIVHTFDVKQRSGQQQRSQTFVWFSATLLYYVCDRAALKFQHFYGNARILSCSTVEGKNTTTTLAGQHVTTSATLSRVGGVRRMLLLKLKRPPLFSFQPGQYAYLRVPKISSTQWHPFSIASGPSSSNLEFYVEVFEPGSWTDQLWNLLVQEQPKSPVSDEEHVEEALQAVKGLRMGTQGFNDKGSIALNVCTVSIDIMGPSGSGLANTQDFSHALAIGTGTGIVPILSLFKQHVRQLLRLAPDVHFHDLREHQSRVLQVEMAEEPRKGSLAKRIVLGVAKRCCRRRRIGRANSHYASLTHKSRTDALRDSIQNSFLIRDEQNQSTGESLVMTPQELKSNMREFKRSAYQATRSIYGIVLLGFLPVFGVALIGFTISWNTIDIDLPSGWIQFLLVSTCIFQGLYAIIALFVWDANQFFAYIDAAICLVAPFADWYWHIEYRDHAILSAAQITLYSLLIGYMTGRTWSRTVAPRVHRSYRAAGVYGSDAMTTTTTLERLDVVWVTRSASLVSEIIPDINSIYKILVDAWGYDYARAVCRIRIYVTDPDPESLRLLKRELTNTLLYQSGSVRFGRPDIGKMIEKHSIDMICSRRSSYSLLAYVGSPELAREIHECKLFNDMKVAITGNRRHQMEFVSESYGGINKAKLSAHVSNKDIGAPESTESSGDDEERVCSHGPSPLDEQEVEHEPARTGRSPTLSTRRTLSYGVDASRNSMRLIRPGV